MGMLRSFQKRERKNTGLSTYFWLIVKKVTNLKLCLVWQNFTNGYIIKQVFEVLLEMAKASPA